MKRQQSLQHRLQTLSALQDAVGAMRSLSAHHFRHARQALGPSRQYRSEINTIIDALGIGKPLQPIAPPGLLVVASDLGLCGDYNSRLFQVALAEVQQQSVTTIYSVGRRVRPMLLKHGVTPFRLYDAPASLDGVSHVLLGLAQDILEDFLSKKIGSLNVVSAAFEGVGHFSPQLTQVLPIQSTTTSLPLRPSPYNDVQHLVLTAIREYLYITLYQILLDALASEHGMRLMAAEAALEWLDNTAVVTSRQLANARSEAATQELLDIVAGGKKRDLT